MISLDSNINTCTNKNTMTSTPADESSSTCSSCSSVRFQNITIREYNRTVGDNPACTSGCPMSIGWSVLSEISIPVDDYEKARPPRRERLQMQIPKDVREDMLMREWDMSYASIREGMLNAAKERENRRRTERKFYSKFNFKMLFCSSRRNNVVASSSSLTSTPPMQIPMQISKQNENTSFSTCSLSRSEENAAPLLDESSGSTRSVESDLSVENISNRDACITNELPHDELDTHIGISELADASSADDLGLDALDATHHSFRRIGIVL